MPSPSTIQILFNNTEDITRYCTFAQSHFETVGTGLPGTGRLVLKDPNRELQFQTGDEIKVIVDGIAMWGGVLLGKGKGHFFPVVDSTDIDAVHDVQWQLNPTDFNIWMDKRVIRDTSDYLHRIRLPNATKLGHIIKQGMADYMDEVPGLDFTTHVINTKIDVSDPDGALLLDQGKTWREQADWCVQQGGFVWYIDPDKKLHFEAFRDLLHPWGFTDRYPNKVTSIGFREGTVSEDGMQMVTDALVWGGQANHLEDAPENVQQVFFARFPDPPANAFDIKGVHYPIGAEEDAIDRLAQYGRWQRAEIHFGQDPYIDQASVTQRAVAITVGPKYSADNYDTGTDLDGEDVGLNKPVWQISLTWFAHDVPGKVHLRPGNIVPLNFYTLGVDAAHPLSLLLPLRTLRMSFPTLPSELPGEDPQTYVRFDGEFGISYSDTRYLWRFLRARGGDPQTVLTTVSNASTSSQPGAIGGFFPNEAPNGSRIDFTLPFGYIVGTTEVYLNGLLQRSRFEYLEADPANGIIRFATAPFADDTIWVVCRTAG